MINAHYHDTVQSLESGVRSRMFDEVPVKINAAIEKKSKN